ncbi:DUF5305 family protein [Oscillibacter sp.]|uniref:DUF5305 family protein n=1 Tax=Oscillibacter sp. TaxID=1945593 RepID=UPI0028A2A08F|nr:DUF5305 family protein [Oscillibacter sp.]
MSENEKKARPKAAVSARGQRRYILGGAGRLVLCAAGLIYAFVPRYGQTEHTLYSYDVTADASYRVHMLENSLYPTEWLEEGGVYSSALADVIEFTFRVDAHGSAPAEISGDYRITAVLEGYQSSGEEKRPVYKTEVPLAEGAMGLSVSRAFSLELSGTARINTAHGERQEDFSYAVALPLPKNSTLFELQKPDPVIRYREITKAEETRLPLSFELLAACGAMGTEGIALILFVRLFTRRLTPQEEERTAREKLKRKYGGRMIRLARPPEYGGRACVPVSDMDGLLAMSEEMRLPACYCADMRGLPQDGLCFVVTPECVYEYRLPSF